MWKKAEEIFLEGIVESNDVAILSLFLSEHQPVLAAHFWIISRKYCSLNDCQVLLLVLSSAICNTNRTDAKETTTKEMVSEFIETFSKLAYLQISFVHLIVYFFEKICITESINAEELIPLFIFLQRHSEKSISIPCIFWQWWKTSWSLPKNKLLIQLRQLRIRNCSFFQLNTLQFI